jgi:AAA domain
MNQISFFQFIHAQTQGGGVYSKLGEWLSRQKEIPVNGSDGRFFHWLKEHCDETELVGLAFKSFERTLKLMPNGSIPPAELIISDLAEYLATTFPPREVLLSLWENPTPILTRQSLNQIFAWRGTGKSLLAAATAISLASGTELLAWKATRPARVLYVDGEMPDEQVQLRLGD